MYNVEHYGDGNHGAELHLIAALVLLGMALNGLHALQHARVFLQLFGQMFHGAAIAVIVLAEEGQSKEGKQKSCK